MLSIKIVASECIYFIPKYIIIVHDYVLPWFSWSSHQSIFLAAISQQQHALLTFSLFPLHGWDIKDRNNSLSFYFDHFKTQYNTDTGPFYQSAIIIKVHHTVAGCLWYNALCHSMHFLVTNIILIQVTLHFPNFLTARTEVWWQIFELQNFISDNKNLFSLWSGMDLKEPMFQSPQDCLSSWVFRKLGQLGVR